MKRSSGGNRPRPILDNTAAGQVVARCCTLTLNMQGLPEDIQTNLKTFNKVLTGIEDQLHTFFSYPLKATTARLTEQEAAKLNLALAYAINTIFYSK